MQRFFSFLVIIIRESSFITCLTVESNFYELGNDSMCSQYTTNKKISLLTDLKQFNYWVYICRYTSFLSLKSIDFNKTCIQN